MTADLFIGLVTHRKSRFMKARSPEGLASQLAQAIRDLGWTAETVVVDDDMLTDEMLTIDRRQVIASIEAEMDVEARWREYVAARPASLRQRAVMAARQARRKVRLAPPWKKQLASDDPGPKMVRRLANIELAHMSIMTKAAKSESRWALLLEDDALAGDPTRLAKELKQFIEAADSSGQPGTINLSESFTIEQLGIRHLLTPKQNEGQPTSWTTWSSERIITNTVCAVLYRHDFLQELVEVMAAIPLAPVIPIDFKVNEAVMCMNGRVPKGTCWVVSPAPIEQGSGVPQVGS